MTEEQKQIRRDKARQAWAQRKGEAPAQQAAAPKRRKKKPQEEVKIEDPAPAERRQRPDYLTAEYQAAHNKKVWQAIWSLGEKIKRRGKK